MATSRPALAQRAGENVVTSATDAFGTSVGKETIGLYNAQRVRGFSPISAGNLRLDGLYFDQLDFLNSRLFGRRVVRVGPSAQGYPFPAPTGIVDHYLRQAGDKPILSIVTDGDSIAGRGVDLDAQLPLSDTFRLAGGISARRESDYPGGDHATILTAGLIAAWQPSDRFELRSFVGRIAFRDDRTTPSVLAIGPELPPVLSQRFLGQKWAAWKADLDNFGLTSRAQLGDWQLRAGLFRFVVSIPHSSSILFLNTDSTGTGRLAIGTDPPQESFYDSGEVRLSRIFEAKDWRHTFHFSARGGQRRRSYGGTDREDFGQVSTGDVPEFPEPDFAFGPLTRDRTTQCVGGVAYHGQWAKRGEVSFGLQKARYRKSVLAPDASAIRTKDDPWLWNGTIAANLSGKLTAYAGYTRGLEESGVAPEIAANRNESPPALLTSQRDLGLFLRLGSRLKMILGGFDVQKPYYNIDADRFFRQLGTVRHRGLEFSASGSPIDGLNLVTGAVLMRARIVGEAVDLGLIGPKPVSQTGRIARFNLDYRPPSSPRFSFDLAVNHTGSRVVSVDNRLVEPGKTIVDIGGRYRFHIGKAPATLRPLLTNLTDVGGWVVGGAGGLRPTPQRRATVSLAVDL